MMKKLSYYLMALALAICLPTNPAKSQTSAASTHDYTIYDTHGTIMPYSYTGQGKKVYANGDETVGHFKNGMEEEFCAYTTKDGKKYVGNFVNGQKDGFGLFTWPNGEEYAGDFKNGFRDGYGIYKWPKGDKYEGNWHNGDQHGYGTYTWKNGSKFTGQWSKGKRNGEGTFFYADGTTRTGFWENDKYVGTSAQSSTSEAATTTQTGADIDYYTARVTADTYLRKGPGTDYDTLTTIPRGERVFLSSTDADEPFRYVLYIDKSEIGYVDSSLLTNIVKAEVNESGNLNIEGRNHKATADIKFENGTDRVITILLGKTRYKLSPKQVKTIKDVNPGRYKIVASAPGVEPDIIRATLKSGIEYSWYFYISTTIIRK